MQKTIKKPIVFLPMLLLLIITSLSANKTLFPSQVQLSAENKSYAIQFQNLQGSNRISEFHHLKAVLDKAATKGYTKADVVKILGTPNHQSSTQLQYWLQEAADKAIVTINIDETTKLVTSYSVTDKQINQ